MVHSTVWLPKGRDRCSSGPNLGRKSMMFKHDHHLKAIDYQTYQCPNPSYHVSYPNTLFKIIHQQLPNPWNPIIKTTPFRVIKKIIQANPINSKPIPKYFWVFHAMTKLPTQAGAISQPRSMTTIFSARCTAARRRSCATISESRWAIFRHEKKCSHMFSPSLGSSKWITTCGCEFWFHFLCQLCQFIEWRGSRNQQVSINQEGVETGAIETHGSTDNWSTMWSKTVLAIPSLIPTIDYRN